MRLGGQRGHHAPQVTADSLRRELWGAGSRGAVNHETYRMLFAEAMQHVLLHARHAGRGPGPGPGAGARTGTGTGTGAWHEVPVAVPGRPAYDIDHAVRYVSEKLRRRGFGVELTGRALLWVDWSAPPPVPRLPPVSAAARRGSDWVLPPPMPPRPVVTGPRGPPPPRPGRPAKPPVTRPARPAAASASSLAPGKPGGPATGGSTAALRERMARLADKSLDALRS